MTTQKGKQLLKNREVESIYPMSAMQQGMLFHSLYAPESGVYVEQITFVLNGTINVDAFQYAWQEVVDRYAVFRTLFVWKDRPTPLQVVVKNVALPWKYMDWQELSTAEQQKQLVELLARQREQGFALNQPPLMDCTLIKLSKEGYRFIWRHHHILMDGWGVPIILREFLSFYEAKVQGKTCYLPAPPPYRDYIVWLTAQDQETAMEFWRQTLQGFCASTPLGVDRLQSDNQRQQSSHYQERKLHVASNVTRALQSLAQQHRATLSTIVQAVWALLLSRYSGERDVVFGVTVSGRPGDLSGVEKMVGLFINTLPLRVQLSPAQRLIHWLEQIQESMVELQQYSYSSLFEIQALSAISGGAPLFESIVVFENYPVDRSLFADSSIELCESKSFEQTNYPLTVVAVQREELLVKISYDTARFESETIERMLGHLETIFTAIAGNPECCVGDIDLLSEAERGQLLVEWNATETAYPREATLAGQFETQVAATPDAVALVFEDQQLTYSQLNSRANHLAQYLHHRCGVGPEVCVGLYMERSVEVVVGLLGILKAGGAYVPLDPDTPRERVAFMLKDADIALVLTQDAFKARLPAEWAGPVIAVDTEWVSIAQTPATNLTSGATAENLAYLMYTSGSTGQPKGISIPQRAVIRLVLETNYIDLTASDRVAQTSTISFDAATFELWGALLNGAQLVIIPKTTALSPEDLAAHLQQHGITTMFLTTALFNQMARDAPETFRGMRHLLFGGEAVDPQCVTAVLQTAPPQRLLHVYGPTENTTFTTWHLTKSVPPGATTVPIGQPLANTQTYVLDRAMQPVPVGVYGELYIGGDGLARDYLQRPALTAETFVPNPFSQAPGARLYKTGDVVRYRSDGTVEFQGRQDYQVKLRGYRIELGEIEAVLAGYPGVNMAVVMVREDRPGDKSLVAYVVASHEPTPTSGELRSFLKEKLPDYMIPSAFVYLECLPITPNGKLDRRALPAPDRNRSQQAEALVAPRDELELQLAKIWEKVLGIKNIGVEDNFFDLGGHSLLAVRLFDRIQKKFGKHFTLATLFQAPTIGQLASIIRQEGYTAPWSSLVPIQDGGSKPPFFCVHGCMGEVAHFHDLARLLGPEQPFYGLRGLGFEEGQVPQTRFEDMAAYYIKEIRAIQSNGPYFIGASGAGCAIALEIAHQLESQGQNVPLLALMIPSNLKPNRSTKTFSNSFRNYLRLSRLYFSLSIIVFKSRLVLPTAKHFFLNRILWHVQICRRYIPGEIHRWHRFVDVFSKALKSYEPEAYQGRIICFLNDEYSHNSKRRRNNKRRIDDWYDLAVGGLDVRLVPGNTFTMWREPHVQILADQLQVCLDEAQRDSKGLKELDREKITNRLRHA
jgi:surfactin family lipopeptide synthetase C